MRHCPGSRPPLLDEAPVELLAAPPPFPPLPELVSPSDGVELQAVIQREIVKNANMERTIMRSLYAKNGSIGTTIFIILLTFNAFLSTDRYRRDFPLLDEPSATMKFNYLVGCILLVVRHRNE